jgi:putative nucleotidyltransferase with HDIG domain
VLRVGTKLTTDAYSKTGLLVLRAGRVIENVRQLSRLLGRDICFGEPPDIVSAKTGGKSRAQAGYQELQKRIQRATALKAEAVERVEWVFDTVEATGTVDIASVEETVSGLVHELDGSPLAMASLIQLKNADAYTFTHSVNVAIMAMYLALQIHCEQDLERIGTGGLLHDIGKIRISGRVLRKPGPLTNFERSLIERHPSDGSRMLMESGFGDPVALSCVVDHHEKLSRRGYPKAKSGAAIGLYARIIALADVFDALTTGRPYRGALKPEDALRLMATEMAHDLDPWLMQRFAAAVAYLIEHTKITPDGKVVPLEAASVQECMDSVRGMADLVPKVDLYR